ncbi:MAG: glycosyltransferase [Thermoplasmata archaeon]|nr:glycosyltransferase [Thermoplasmata archaeon]
MDRVPSSFSIVVPWLDAMMGHRVSINLAQELADRGAKVDFLVGLMNRTLVGPVSKHLGAANPTYLGFINNTHASIPKYATYQYNRTLDRKLARSIADAHRRTPYDVVLVLSNEGHWIASYLRRYLPSQRPTLAVCVRELVENPFWLGYERPWPRARRLMSPLYPWIHDAESERLREFDRVYSISPWTSLLLDYFYGIRQSPTLAMIDRSFFEIPTASTPGDYVAVPTAALDRSGISLVQEVAELVPNLRTYGPLAVPGIPHEGFLSDPDLVSFVAAAAATLFIFDYEALGLIPIESLAAGTPVATIPKEGPRLVLSGNPGVRFGTTSAELSTALVTLSKLSVESAWRKLLRNSVAGFHPSRATTAFLSTLSRPLGVTSATPS